MNPEKPVPDRRCSCGKSAVGIIRLYDDGRTDQFICGPCINDVNKSGRKRNIYLIEDLAYLGVLFSHYLFVEHQRLAKAFGKYDRFSQVQFTKELRELPNKDVIELFEMAGIGLEGKA